MRSPAARGKWRPALRQTHPRLQLAELQEQPSPSPTEKSKPSCAKSEADDDLLPLALRHQALGPVYLALGATKEPQPRKGKVGETATFRHGKIHAPRDWFSGGNSADEANLALSVLH